jgi:NADH:ubiquinone oxidoreductase subunit F (NADH-binding)
MHDIVADICGGRGEPAHIQLLEDLAEAVRDASLCALGGTAPNPVLSTLRYFPDEYEAHINEKKCPAGVCRALIRYRIEPEKCKGCMLCNKQCPEQAINGKVKEPQAIDEEKCIKCGVCRESCKFEAVLVE